MTDQLCACGHPHALHRANPQIGNREECWAVGSVRGWCPCRQFQPAPEEPTPADDARGG